MDFVRMKKIFYFIIICFTPLFAQGQIKTVSYATAKNQLNGGMPLPSEEIFYLEGTIPPSVRLVTLEVFRSKKSERSAYTYRWKAPYLIDASQFELFVTNPLRSNERYHMKFSFYERAGSDDLQELKAGITKNLEAYIRANYEVSRKGLQALASQRVMMTQLNEIVIQGLGNYAHPLDQEFQGFSDVVRQKIEQTNNLRLRNAKFNILRNKEDASRDEAIYANQLIDELIQLTTAEAEQYLRANLLMLVDIREIQSYPTEKRPFYLPVNVGYAGTYFGGDFNSLDYGTSPFVGVAFPLGRRTFTKFLGNASISTGVFTNTMRNSDGVSISGPLIGRPTYVGLGYSMFRILRFNAGIALTSSEVNGSLENVTIYPFVGFSMEFNIWLGLNR
ncbi:hypothetical protein ADIS_1194 [Lunatimonas lonarensis]|uniref:Uncharacterized protein n=2 Tax=Lunatimonas lonarensis TaxID=1232681 RepID=R7ZW07_9BACT|nr:hypothetical protein ADIS_1194 [Lunatimonas lonarensis]